MPEIAEVHTIYTQIRQEIEKHDAGYLTVDYYNKVVNGNPVLSEITAHSQHAKYILLDSKELTVMIHLGMAGRVHYTLLTENTADEISSAYKHCKGIITFYTKQQKPTFRLIITDSRSFGKFLILKAGERTAHITRLGIDPLKPEEFTLPKFIKAIHKHATTVATLLINQDAISGIGNYLRSEILFEAGISPFRYTTQLDEEDEIALYEAIKLVVKRAVDAKGCSLLSYADIYGNQGKMQHQLMVYHKQNTPCPNCGDLFLLQQAIGDGARRVFYCENCQL